MLHLPQYNRRAPERGRVAVLAGRVIPDASAGSPRLNLLVRIDRELGGDIDVSRFRHRAWFDEEHSRIVMELVSTCAQMVTIDHRRYRFAEGEVITTEYSHKYTRESFAKLGAAADLAVAQVWMDGREWFSVQRLVARR